MKTVVIMPTYNEAENLPEMVLRLLALNIDGLQLLVVDDNSPDGTGKIAEELAARHPGFIEVIHRTGKLGFGTAYVIGFLRALEKGTDFIIQMDADFSHPPETIPLFLAEARQWDVVVGSRYVPGGRVDPHWSWRRRLLSWGGNLYARWVTGVSVRDVTAGFKGFRREVLEALPFQEFRSDGFAFQVETAYACHRKGFKVKEIPILFIDRAYGRSKMSWKIIWEAFWRVWQIRWRSSSV